MIDTDLFLQQLTNMITSGDPLQIGIALAVLDSFGRLYSSIMSVGKNLTSGLYDGLVNLIL